MTWEDVPQVTPSPLHKKFCRCKHSGAKKSADASTAEKKSADASTAERKKSADASTAEKNSADASTAERKKSADASTAEKKGRRPQEESDRDPRGRTTG